MCDDQSERDNIIATDDLASHFLTALECQKQLLPQYLTKLSIKGAEKMYPKHMS